MIRTAVFRLLGPSLVVLTLAAAACSSSGDDGGGSTSPRYDPARADELAHAMMLQPGDLPGSGWEVTAEDAFDDDEEDFDAIAAGVPECDGLSDLSRLGDPLGGSGDEMPAGRAKVEIERPGSGPTPPSSVEMEVELEDTVVAVQGDWGLAKQMFESRELRECFPALMKAAMLQELPEDSVDVSVEEREPSARPPGDGVAMAFELKLKLSDLLDISMVLEMYMWPDSNAGVSVLITHDSETLTKDDVQKSSQGRTRR